MEELFKPVKLADGFYFTEGPRWHNGQLWVSDFYDHKVFTVDRLGQITNEYEVETQPSGMGWSNDGSFVVTSMTDKAVLIDRGSGLEKLADISSYCGYWANDLIVTPQDFVYVGNFGFDLDALLEEKGPDGILTPPGPPQTNLVLVTLDGRTEIAAENMAFPNGMVVTKDSKTLIVAETFGFRLTAFDINADGTLSNRRIFADLSPYICVPDGISIDENDNIWVANAVSNEVLHVKEGGEVLNKVSAPLTCFATAVGGADNDTLFMMCAPTSTAKVASANRNGVIYCARIK